MPVLSEYSLDGKVAFIAGEGDDSTPALAEALAEAGARVFIMAPHYPVVEGSMRAVARLGGHALGSFGDPADPEALEKALDSFLPLWDQVDILVNNTRVPFAKPFEEVSRQEWDEVMRRNVGSAYLLCHRLGREMLRQGGGRIVNVISGLAERGLWNSAAFCASQGAVLQLTRALALEWARRNIRVNAAGVGWYATEETSQDEAQKDLLVRYIPLKRKGHPRDIAPLVVYLASDACEFTTGQAIYVDGGLMSHA